MRSLDYPSENTILSMALHFVNLPLELYVKLHDVDEPFCGHQTLNDKYEVEHWYKMGCFPLIALISHK